MEVEYLSVHWYAPEMNEAVCCDGVRYKIPGVYDIDEAIAYIERNYDV